jgi:hypothetical protein
MVVDGRRAAVLAEWLDCVLIRAVVHQFACHIYMRHVRWHLKDGDVWLDLASLAVFRNIGIDRLAATYCGALNCDTISTYSCTQRERV